jgi:hypothetical protein
MTTAELVKQDAGTLDAQKLASKIEAALASGRKALWELTDALAALVASQNGDMSNGRHPKAAA